LLDNLIESVLKFDENFEELVKVKIRFEEEVLEGKQIVYCKECVPEWSRTLVFLSCEYGIRDSGPGGVGWARNCQSMGSIEGRILKPTSL